VNILRRLPLSRLLLLCGLVLAIGVSATALALGLSTGPVPAPKPLANAVHDALAAPKVSGVSARIQLTNHLLEGASLASSGGGEASQLAGSPLIAGASGRMWIDAGSGRARLELQSEKGDTQIIYDGHTVTLYDASTNTIYRYTPKQETPSTSESGSPSDHQIPTVAEIQEAIDHLSQHEATVSAATPTDVAGQPAYTIRVSPARNGGMIGGAELSFDAVHGVPLRAALYSSTSSSPVLELAASEISYGPVESSVFEFQPPADAKVQEVELPGEEASSSSGTSGQPGSGQTSSGPVSGGSSERPKVTTHGEGLSSIVLVESPVKAGSQSSTGLPEEGLQKVQINGVSASELPTALGTLLYFERAGVRYLLVGAVNPATIEAFARGL
jgi:outer membrane lipoprotein-sorting protein